MYLGIDIGASFCKAVVIDHNLNVLYSTRKEMPNSIDTVSVKVVEYDINEIIHLIYDLIKSITKQVLMQIDGIGVSGQMHGILLLDKLNNPVTNFISWQDQRATEFLSESQETYLNFLKDNLLNYINLTGTDLRSGMMGPLLFWFKRKGFFNNNTEIKATFISDYLVSVLTENEPLCDPTNASGSGIYNIKDGEWLNEYFEITGIDYNILPNVVESKSLAGQLAYSQSKKLNMKQGTPVYVSIGDYQATLISSKLNDSSISINVGTGAQVSLLINEYPDSVNYEIRPYINDTYLKCVTGLPGGRLLALFEKFLKNIFHEFSFSISKVDILYELDSLCVKNISDTDIVCKPNFFDYNIDSDSGFANITKSNFNIKELYYSTIRACVQEYYDSFNKIRIPVTYKKDCKILLTGGVINKSKLMSNIIIDLFNYDVIHSEFEEEAAVGAAMIAIPDQN
jgi:sugar (pentulose or hexulose) kinase